jgi:aryl-alcohol dehydrogenase-like predicted oxidoreductase
LAIAWLLARGKDIVPVIGARRPGHLTEVFASCNLNLTADGIAAVETAIPKNAVHGARYPDSFLAHLDSER